MASKKQSNSKSKKNNEEEKKSRILGEESALSKLLGTSLVRKSGRKVHTSELEREECIAVYFSAHWCRPCAQFTPVLKQRCEQVRKQGRRMQVVFVSADRNQTEFEDYFSKDMGDWLAVPFADSERRSQLQSKLNERGFIPHVTLLDSHGEVLSQRGREAIEQDKSAYLFPWRGFRNKYSPPSLARRIAWRLLAFLIAFVALYYFNRKNAPIVTKLR